MGPLLLALSSFFVALVACEGVRLLALRRRLLDEVNERSLHTLPTPRLGGVAVVLATIAMSMVAVGGWPSRALGAVLAMGGTIALLGLRDDVKPLSAPLRLLMQVVAAITFVWWVGTPPLWVARGFALPIPAVVTSMLLVVWIVGVLNIFNFMDGMDGLAGSQTIFASLAARSAFAGHGDLQAFCVSLAAGAAGFLAHNMPPARMFLGDAGSTFIGMTLAALAVVGLHLGIPITESALALAPFLLDGTFTLLRRARKGERIWKAHRTHLYQRAVQTGLEHRSVLLVYVAWMSLCAVAAVLSSANTLCLVAGWVFAGAGLVLVWRWVRRRESEQAARS